MKIKGLQFACFIMSLFMILSITSSAFLTIDEIDSISSAIPSANITKLNGDFNILTITIQDNNGTYSQEFIIENNADNEYYVAGYTIYVSTYGNDKIDQCYLVSYITEIDNFIMEEEHISCDHDEGGFIGIQPLSGCLIHIWSPYGSHYSKGYTSMYCAVYYNLLKCDNCAETKEVFYGNGYSHWIEWTSWQYIATATACRVRYNKCSLNCGYIANTELIIAHSYQFGTNTCLCGYKKP